MITFTGDRDLRPVRVKQVEDHTMEAEWMKSLKKTAREY